MSAFKLRKSQTPSERVLQQSNMRKSPNPGTVVAYRPNAGRPNGPGPNFNQSMPKAPNHQQQQQQQHQRQALPPPPARPNMMGNNQGAYDFPPQPQNYPPHGQFNAYGGPQGPYGNMGMPMPMPGSYHPGVGNFSNIPPIEPPGPSADHKLVDLVPKLPDEDNEDSYLLKAPRLTDVVFGEDRITPEGIMLSLTERKMVDLGKIDARHISYAMIAPDGVRRKELTKEQAFATAKQRKERLKLLDEKGGDDEKSQAERAKLLNTKIVVMRKCKFSLKPVKGERVWRFDVQYHPSGGSVESFAFQTHQMTCWWDQFMGKGNWVDQRDPNNPAHEFAPEVETQTAFQLSFSRNPVTSDRAVEGGPCENMDKYWVKFADAYLKFQMWMVRTALSDSRFYEHFAWPDKAEILQRDPKSLTYDELHWICDKYVNNHYSPPLPPGVKRPPKTKEQRAHVPTLEESKAAVPGHLSISVSKPAFAKIVLRPGQTRTYCNEEWARNVEIKFNGFMYTHVTDAKVQYMKTEFDEKDKPMLVIRDLDQWERQSKKILNGSTVVRAVCHMSLLPKATSTGFKGKHRLSLAQVVIVGSSPREYGRGADPDNEEVEVPEENQPQEGEESMSSAFMDEEERIKLERRKRAREMSSNFQREKIKAVSETASTAGDKDQTSEQDGVDGEGAQEEVYDQDMGQQQVEDEEAFENAMGQMPMESSSARRVAPPAKPRQQLAPVAEVNESEYADPIPAEQSTVVIEEMTEEVQEGDDPKFNAQPEQPIASVPTKPGQGKQFAIPSLDDEPSEEAPPKAPVATMKRKKPSGPK